MLEVIIHTFNTVCCKGVLNVIIFQESQRIPRSFHLCTSLGNVEQKLGPGRRKTGTISHMQWPDKIDSTVDNWENPRSHSVNTETFEDIHALFGSRFRRYKTKVRKYKTCKQGRQAWKSLLTDTLLKTKFALLVCDVVDYIVLGVLHFSVF